MGGEDRGKADRPIVVHPAGQRNNPRQLGGTGLGENSRFRLN